MRVRLLRDGRFVGVPLDCLEWALDVTDMLVRTNPEKEVRVVPYLFTDAQDEEISRELGEALERINAERDDHLQGRLF